MSDISVTVTEADVFNVVVAPADTIEVEVSPPVVIGVELSQGPKGADGADGAGGVPNGGAIGDFIEKLSSTNGDAEWKDATYIGFSSNYGAVNLVGLKATLDFIMGMTRLAPTISLTATGSGTVREKGDTVSSTDLTATVVKKSDPIAEVRFYQSPATLLDTETGTIPTGGTSTYTYGTPFSDTIAFLAKVDDDGSTGGVNTITSNTVTFSFLYPYYWGSHAAGLAAADVSTDLTKAIAGRPSSLTFTAPGGEVFYLVYPVASGALSSIKDSLGFETIGDWTRSTISITGLDSTAQSYYMYEFNNVVTAGSFPYTFS